MFQSYHIQELELVNFKSYESARVRFGQGLNVITGKNGVGKTSILDAIRLLVFGKSYFASSDKACLKYEQAFMRASAMLSNEEKDIHKLVVKIQAGKTKVLEHDGKKITRRSEYVGEYLSVCISPEDIILVNGISSDRRSFLDQAISQFDKKYIHSLVSYNKALKQRNALLKQFLKQNYFDQNLLDAFDKIMIETAPYIFEARENFMKDFMPTFQKSYEEIAPQKEEVGLMYQSKLRESSMKELLEEYGQKDKFSGRSNVGTHKDDLILQLNGHEVKMYGSQGQIKSYVFALKMALFEYFLNKTNKLPILLLDDIFDKLDQSRVEKILDRFQTKWSAQVFISDTDKDRISKFLQDKGKMIKHIHILEDQSISYPDV